MNKRWLILSFFFLLFTCGCDVEYTLQMKGNQFEEDFRFSGTKSAYEQKGRTNAGKEEMVDFLYIIETGTNDFDRKILYESNNVIYQYNRNFSITEIEFWPSFSRLCFDTVEALYTDKGTMVIQTSSIADCYKKYKELNHVTINFETDYEVLESNADKEENGVYTWYFSKNENMDQKIYLDVKYNREKEEVKNGSSKEVQKGINIAPILWGVVVVVLIIGGIYFLVNKIRKNNQF